MLIILISFIFQASSAWNRVVQLYDRRVKRISVGNPNSCDFRATLDVEKEKTAEVNRKFDESKREVRRLLDEVSKVTHHRTGLLAERDRLNDEVNDLKQKFNELVDHLCAEKKGLRGRRDEYDSYCQSRGLAKMARLVQKRLIRIKANIDDNKAIEPKYLEYNQVRGNIKMLEALVETKEIEVKFPVVFERLEKDLKALNDEVRAHEITDIQTGDFDAYTLFDIPRMVMSKLKTRMEKRWGRSNRSNRTEL
ncbi:hypothetical protein AtNW77_Chr5g0113141 [Arabidopsis thaliana]